MHPIPVRIMKFEVPAAADFHPLYIADSAALSYSHTAFGLYVAVLEPFAVKSFRRVLDRIRDGTLRENVERFSRQEAQHYQRHIDFNKVVLAHGYPGLDQRLDQLRADLEGFLGDASEQFCIGYVEGFESYTTQFALQMIGSGLYDHKRTHVFSRRPAPRRTLPHHGAAAVQARHVPVRHALAFHAAELHTAQPPTPGEHCEALRAFHAARSERALASHV